jgi:hypothetical protein
MKRETDLESGGDNVRSAGFLEELALSRLFAVDKVRGAEAARPEGAAVDEFRDLGGSACSKSRLNLQTIRTEQKF